MLAVETKGLTKNYAVGFAKKKARPALRQLDLQVEIGEAFGLLGPNGAGKSTALKILFRLVRPTSGSARILGEPLENIRTHRRLGYLPENPSFYDHLTAAEFLDYMGSLHGLSRTETRRRAGDLLHRAGLEEFRDLPLRKFSRGMIQRVGITQALINDPEMVFLDEPMSGLDPIGRREVRNLILELRQEGKTVFFSTHILADAEAICDRVAILNRGRLQGCGELRKVLAQEVAGLELVVEDPGPEVLRAFKPLASSMVQTGDRVRIEFPANIDTERVFRAAVEIRAKVISLNPIKMSLEDYFISEVNRPPETPAPEITSHSEAKLLS